MNRHQRKRPAGGVYKEPKRFVTVKRKPAVPPGSSSHTAVGGVDSAEGSGGAGSTGREPGEPIKRSVRASTKTKVSKIVHSLSVFEIIGQPLVTALTFYLGLPHTNYCTFCKLTTQGEGLSTIPIPCSLGEFNEFFAHNDEIKVHAVHRCSQKTVSCRNELTFGALVFTIIVVG